MEKKPARKSDQAKEHTATYDDYAKLPEDGPRYELVDGELQMLPSASSRHQSVGVQLSHLLILSCESDYAIFYELDVILSNIEVRRPDLTIVRRDRLSIVSERGIEGPPDVVVEILSPWSSKRDKLDKTKSYARFGVPEYWIIDPANSNLEQYTLDGQVYQLTNVFVGDEPIQSNQLPCVTFSMETLMKRVIPAM